MINIVGRYFKNNEHVRFRLKIERYYIVVIIQIHSFKLIYKNSFHKLSIWFTACVL